MKALRIAAIAILPFGLVAYGLYRATSTLWSFLFHREGDHVRADTLRSLNEREDRRAYLAEMEVGGGQAVRRSRTHGVVGPNTETSRYDREVRR